jgi:hypothetical protein
VVARLDLDPQAGADGQVAPGTFSPTNSPMVGARSTGSKLTSLTDESCCPGRMMNSGTHSTSGAVPSATVERPSSPG